MQKSLTILSIISTEEKFGLIRRLVSHIFRIMSKKNEYEHLLLKIWWPLTMMIKQRMIIKSPITCLKNQLSWSNRNGSIKVQLNWAGYGCLSISTKLSHGMTIWCSDFDIKIGFRFEDDVQIVGWYDDIMVWQYEVQILGWYDDQDWVEWGQLWRRLIQ